MSEAANLSAIHRLVWTALLAALVAVGAIIAIPVGPLGPVPITLQTMFVLLAGLILGPRGGALVILLYWAAGALGLPVFAGGKAGVAVFLGPSGGFLWGFLPSAIIAGLAGGLPPKPVKKVLPICLAASALCLILGALQMMVVLDISLGKALAAGVTPFLPGAVIKCLSATAIYRFLAAHRLLPL